jgi:hypothetical protein
VEVCDVVGEGATFTGTELLLGVGVGVDFTVVLLEEDAGVDFTEVLLEEDVGAEDAGVDEGSSQPSSVVATDTSTPLLQETPVGIWH